MGFSSDCPTDKMYSFYMNVCRDAPEKSVKPLVQTAGKFYVSSDKNCDCPWTVLRTKWFLRNFAKNIAIENCICYNAIRQRKVTIFPCRQRTKPPTVLHHSRGFLLFFYRGKAPTRLFVVLIVPVKPFADEVANHTRCDSHKESDN